MTDEPTPALTAPQIELVALSYTRQMARFEDAALLVEQRLRRELRAETVRALLSSRAKHPDDLRTKLGKKSSDPRYTLPRLLHGIDRIVTDLAGCRVLVYQESDVEKVGRVVLGAFGLADLDGKDELHAKESGYRARHLLVVIPDSEERQSLRGTICEVQVSTLAAHVFNELSHDIEYKDHGVPVGPGETEALLDVRAATRLLDRSAERVLAERESSVARQTRPLEDAEDLRFMLEREAGRRLHGDFADLFRLLAAVLQPLTMASVVGDSGTVPRLLERGAERAATLGLDGDDVVHAALALCDRNAAELAFVMRGRRGPSTLLKKAVLQASEEKKTT